MATNMGKYHDRSPLICAAGKLSDSTETVAKCLREYPLEDKVNALKHDAHIFEERSEHFRYKLPSLQNDRYEGIYTKVREILQSPVKTRYQKLIEELKETNFDSYWTRQVGKGRDPTAQLPVGMRPMDVTFGKVAEKEDNKDVISPPKGTIEVLLDSQKGHELYKKTHNDYNAGEQRDRGYTVPPYNAKKLFGQATNCDSRGVGMQCCTHWYESEPVLHANYLQADNLEKRQPRVGKCLAPMKNIESVPEGHRFGKPSVKGMHGTDELLKDADIEPCMFKRDFFEWMEHINDVRFALKKLEIGGKFSFNDFYRSIPYFDKENTGWIPLKLLYTICQWHHVSIEPKIMERIMNFMNILNNGYANYRVFCDLIDVSKPCPLHIKLDDVPKENQHYISTAQAMACDYLIINNADKPIAGLPAIRFDKDRPVVPPGGIKAHLESLGDETESGAIVNPSVLSNYGITHIDFFQPRTPDFMRKLFENVGYQFPDETFGKLWKIGIETDKSGAVCVDTFNNLIMETVSPPKFIPPEEKVC